MALNTLLEQLEFLQKFVKIFEYKSFSLLKITFKAESFSIFCSEAIGLYYTVIE
jgi:hypothetical protein